MKGFSADWLALREPADHAARNAAMSAAMVDFLASHDALAIIDLGCGTGSNLRALAPRLPQRQHWLCVDHDQALLDEAARLLKAAPLARCTVDYLRADLTRDLPAVLDRGADLVTAAAFFDLWSQEAICAFCEELARRRLPLYTVLTYNGVEHWEPPHEADAAIQSAFIAHQHTDKGFGPAAGPHASLALITALQHHGYQVSGGESPWVLEEDQRPLIRALADGIAAAAAETGMVEAGVIEDWRMARRQSTGRIGHMDLFAVPPAV